MKDSVFIISKSEYKKAFKEVIVILKFISKSNYDKIPKDVLKIMEKEQDLEYDYCIDFKNGFKEQKMSDITKAILANFYRDYWATNEERKKILNNEKLQRTKIENELKEIYNPDDIFKNRNKFKKYEQLGQDKDLVIIETKWYIKMFNMIKVYLKNRKST